MSLEGVKPTLLEIVLLLGFPLNPILTLATDGAGAFDFNIAMRNDQTIVGIPIFMRVLTHAQGYIETSNALEIIVGP